VSSRFKARPPVFYGWFIVATALTMNLGASPLNAAIFSFFVTPMSQDLGWSRGDLSWAYTVRLAVAGVSGPLLGMLLDRFGGRIIGAVAGLVAGFSVLALAGVHSLLVFYALFAISGLAGFGAPAGQLLTTVPVSKWFHLNRGRALAIATVGLPLGTTIFIPVVEALIQNIGWREAWAISGVIVLALVVIPCALLMRKDPESMGLYPDGLDHPPALPERGADTGEQTATAEDWTASQVLRSPAMWMIVAAMTCSGLVLPGTVLYRVSFWQEVGLSPGVIALATAIDPFAVTISALVCGFIAERVQTRYLGFAGGLIVGCSMLAMVFARDNVYLLFAYNIVWGIGMGANITVNNIIWPNYYGRRFLGTIRGVVFPITVGASALSAPLFATLLDSTADDRYVWLLSLAAFWIAGLLVLAAKRPRMGTTPSAEARTLQAPGS
jgi:sugar phosphate permease